MPEELIYVIRPGNTALWLPPELLKLIDAWPGEQLSEEQFQSPVIQQRLADCIIAQQERKKRK